MEHRPHTLLDKLADLRIARGIGTRVILVGTGSAHIRQHGPDLALAADGLDGEVHVDWVGEPLGINERGRGHIRAGEGDRAAGEGSNKSGVQGSVVVAVEGVSGLLDLIIAIEGGDREPFDLGPVVREGG